MIVLQESPDFTQSRQVLNLNLRKFSDADPGASVELMINIKNGLPRLRFRRLPNWLTIHQQLQIVRPRFSGPDQQHTEEESRRLREQMQLDGVFLPSRGSLQLLVLHVVECEVGSCAVLAQPQAGEVAHIFRAQESPQLNRFTQKSIGMKLPMLVKSRGLSECRSIRADHRPP